MACYLIDSGAISQLALHLLNRVELALTDTGRALQSPLLLFGMNGLRGYNLKASRSEPLLYLYESR